MLGRHVLDEFADQLGCGVRLAVLSNFLGDFPSSSERVRTVATERICLARQVFASRLHGVGLTSFSKTRDDVHRFDIKELVVTYREPCGQIIPCRIDSASGLVHGTKGEVAVGNGY